MKKSSKKYLSLGIGSLVTFAAWTMLIQYVDVQAVGVNETKIGFAAFNCWFHKLIGVHMTLYVITDWLGLVPLVVCTIFGGIGFIQLLKRKSLLKVDYDILFLGVYYMIVIFGYLIFEIIPLNYRPILINGFMEASYPSSTTLLVLSVMPTLIFQTNRRMKNIKIKNIICAFTILFSVFMVIGRLISGVHWFTDIVGSVMLSAGLLYIYKAVVILCDKEY